MAACRVVSAGLGLILAAFGSSLGCGQEVVAPVETPKSVHAVDLTAGKVNASLVGDWINPRETYRLKADGTFSMHFDRMERFGPGTATTRKVGDLKGKWTATDDTLLLSVTSGQAVVNHKLKFTVHEGGAVMELRPTFLTRGTGMVYRRSKVAKPPRDAHR